MSSKLPCDLLDWFDTTSHDERAPIVEKPTCPGRITVLPEVTQLLSQEISPDGFKVCSQQFPQLDVLRRGEILRSLQETPTGAFQRLISLAAYLACLLGSHLIERLVEIAHNMKPVKDVKSVWRLLGDYFYVRSPHVAADELESCGPLLSQHAKESQKPAYRTPSRHPQKPPRMRVYLIYHRQKSFLRAPLDLINTHRRNAGQIPIGKPILNHPSHRTEYTLPGRAELVGDISPA